VCTIVVEMFKRKASSQRLVELETENEQVKLQNETLKHENETLCKDSSQRLGEMETENKQLKLENDTLKLKNETLNREITELRETVDKLEQSLDESVRSTKPKPQPAPRSMKPKNSQSQASSETTNTELKQLIRHLQDRLTVAEQVTAATQRRQLVQEGLYENLSTTGIYETLTTASVYEELLLDTTQEPVYAKLQLTTHTGCMIVFSSSCAKIFTFSLS